MLDVGGKFDLIGPAGFDAALKKGRSRGPLGRYLGLTNPFVYKPLQWAR